MHTVPWSVAEGHLTQRGRRRLNRNASVITVMLFHNGNDIKLKMNSRWLFMKAGKRGKPAR